MTTSPLLGHFKLEASPDFAPLREALQRADFTASALAKTLAVQNPADGIDIPMLLLRTGEPTAYHVLTRLFILQQTVAEASAREAVRPMPLETLLDCNLLRRAGGGAQATVKLAPFDQFYFVSDFSHPYKGRPLPSDFVLGVGPSSVSLANLTVRRPVGRALDVGAGAGVQAILASTHGRKVVGIDTNARALNFAALNARLNGVANVEWLQGSFFEPAAGLFDLIVANPPFVISPESSLLYRDGGGQGDLVSEHVAREAGRHLNEGGFAAMLLNWHHAADDDWPARPLQWLEGNGCDNWLLRFTVQEPLLYAANWLRQTELQQPQLYSRHLAEWTDYYEKAGIHRISSGALIQRKRAGGRNWMRCDSLQGAHAGGPCGDHILRIFAGEDYLRSVPEAEALLDGKFSVQPELRVNHALALREGQWTTQELLMNLERGLPFPGHADPQLLRLLSCANGQRSLRECIDLVARDFHLTPASLTRPCVEVARRLIGAGVLNPCPPPPA